MHNGTYLAGSNTPVKTRLLLKAANDWSPESKKEFQSSTGIPKAIALGIPVDD